MVAIPVEGSILKSDGPCWLGDTLTGDELQLSYQAPTQLTDQAQMTPLEFVYSVEDGHSTVLGRVDISAYPITAESVVVSVQEGDAKVGGHLDAIDLDGDSLTYTALSSLPAG